MKKRGTDHVTGFYANRLEARQSTSSDDTRFKYGRFLISGMNPEDRDTSRCGSKRTSLINNNYQGSKKRQEIPLMSCSSSGRSRQRSRTDSDTESHDSPEDTSRSRNVFTVNEKLRTYDPDQLSGSARIKHETDFQMMEQQALPADHPFCNLDNPEYVWPRVLATCPGSGQCDTDPLFKLTNDLGTKSSRLTAQRRNRKTRRKQLFTPREVETHRPGEGNRLDEVRRSASERSSTANEAISETALPNDEDEPLDLSLKPIKTFRGHLGSNRDQSLHLPSSFVQPQFYYCPTARLPVHYLRYHREHQYKMLNPTLDIKV